MLLKLGLGQLKTAVAELFRARSFTDAAGKHMLTGDSKGQKRPGAHLQQRFLELRGRPLQWLPVGGGLQRFVISNFGRHHLHSSFFSFRYLLH